MIEGKNPVITITEKDKKLEDDLKVVAEVLRRLRDAGISSDFIRNQFSEREMLSNNELVAITDILTAVGEL